MVEQYRAKAVDIAWLAGLVDGEGHISLYCNQRGFLCVKTHFEVTLANRECVDKARNIIYALTHKKYAIKERKGPHLKHVAFSLRVLDQKGCRKVCEALLPYLVGKKELAELMVKFCDVRKAAKGIPGRYNYGATEFGIIETMKQALRHSYSIPLPRVETEREAPRVVDGATVQAN